MSETGSSVPRRSLGRHLRQAREHAGFTIEAAAHALEWSRARMYRVENGEVGIKAYEIKRACELYGVAEEMTDVLCALAREGKTPGWWHAYGAAIPSWFELFVGLESVAREIRQYSMGLVPGLLQTKEYARAVFATKPGISAAELDQKVAARMERQHKVFNGPTKRVTMLLDESVLRRRIVDSPAMAEQLHHLARIAKAKRPVSLRVLPFSRTVPVTVNGFTILDFPKIGRYAEPTTVYVEATAGDLYLDKASDVDRYAEIWRTLMELALSTDETVDFINSVVEETWT